MMESYEQRVPILDFLARKTDLNLEEFSEAPENLEDSIRDAFDDLQCAQLRLHEHVAALRARNKELEDYASTVAHDLKQPLAAMILTANLITRTPDLTVEELHEDLQQIRSTAYQMNTIINSLLLFAKVSRAEAPVERLDMAWVVKNVRDRLSQMINEHQGRLDLPESWPEAFGYGPWVEEVWANYISNALKHGGRPPRVELGASTQSDGMIRFWTRDNGPGLPPEAQTRLFAPLSQINPMRTQGHGLGLSIVLSIVEKLGGQVGLESEAGKGNLFFFTLPATASTLQTRA
jgi:two-component system, sensor histidine kinase and response regulator